MNDPNTARIRQAGLTPVLSMRAIWLQKINEMDKVIKSLPSERKDLINDLSSRRKWLVFAFSKCGGLL